MTTQQVVVYYRVGHVERGNGKPGYDWHDGYSTCPKGTHQPWRTKKEAIADEKMYGRKAVFEEP